MRKLIYQTLVLAVLFASGSQNVCCAQQAKEQNPAPSAKSESIDKTTYLELLEDFQELKIDRDNLIVQLKKLLKFKNDHQMETEGLQTLKEEKEALNSQNILLEEELIMLSTANEKLDMELEQAKLRVIELEAVGSESKVKKKLAELKKSKNKKIKELEAGAKADTIELKKKIRKLEKAYKKDKAAWDSELKSSEKEINKLERSWDSKLKSSEKEIAKLQRSIKQLEDKVSKRDNKIDKKSDEIDQLEGELREAQGAIFDLKKEARRIPEKYRTLAKDNEALSKQLADVHYNLGVFYSNEQHFVRAIKEFKETIKLRPYDKKAIYNLGLIYAQHEVDREKALHYFNRYLQIDNNSSSAQWAKAYVIKWEAWRREAKDVLR